MDSILNLVKKSCGVEGDYTVFDDELITHINSVFMVLRQMGVGPARGFRIEDENAIWSDFIPNDAELYESVKTYMCAKVRLIFDPPTSSSYVNALKEIVTEFEWRLNWEAELEYAQS